MALNAWQKITRVLPGMPHGDGRDGNINVSTNTTQSQTKGSASAGAGSTSLTTNVTSFANGDVVVIHNSQAASNAGQWEVNMVVGGGGTTGLTLKVATQYAYSTGSQIIRLPMYKQVIVSASATWSAPVFDRTTGGWLLFAAQVVADISGGTLSADATGYQQNGTGSDNFGRGHCGDGSIGSGASLQQNAANGSGGGGGGGGTRETPGGGAGGGHATAGGNGTGSGPGIGGGTVGEQTLQSNILFGGGGGAGGGGYNAVGYGGVGGGIVAMWVKKLIAPNLISSKGQIGQNGTSGTYNSGDGGGGAGGSILIIGEDIDIGTDKLTVAGGAAGTGGPGADGGAGGKGRVAIYYGTKLSGSLGSTYYGSYYTDTDKDLIAAVGGAFLLFV